MTNYELRITNLNNKKLGNRFSVFSILLLTVVFLSFSAAKRMSPEDYIDQYKEIAVKEMKRSGIPASITLAQGILESDNGNSSLAVKANNHFGIKCHKSWDGKTYHQDDDADDECFRKYNSAEQSYDDHTEFLTTGSRYAFLFDYKSNDYKSWAKGLKKAGYATNRKYPELLINIIEKYELYRFDEGDISYKPSRKEQSTKRKGKDESREEFSISVPVHRKVMMNNEIEYVLAKEGETLADIASEFDKMRWELPKYNDIAADNVLSEGQMVYLQPKRRKASVDNEFHTLEIGQSMLYVSQKYGVKMKRLFRMNRMEVGAEIVEGQKIWLRGRKPKI